jgi:hypothetical protein
MQIGGAGYWREKVKVLIGNGNGGWKKFFK